jgi:RNA ligase-like protein
MTSWHSYPSVYNLGHRYLTELLLDPVLVEEKIDGSQFSFGVFEDEQGTRFVRCRSKGAEINVLAPDNMFKKGVQWVLDNQERLNVGWTYRGEYLCKPKHNALAYDRIPNNNIIIFDINIGEEEYLSYEWKAQAALDIGLEVVPQVHYGKIEDLNHFRMLLDTTSCLGGQKVEGVVIKNYNRFGLDKKVLLGKFVSESYKEVHGREWKADNPSKQDVVQMLIASLKTPARWNKAIEHMRDAGKLEDSPRDIGVLMKEVPTDIEKEEMEYIKDKLYQWAWPHIRRGVTGGLPEFYKERLLARQFEHGGTDIETKVQP